MRIFIDFETRSAVNLIEVGAWAYAAHPTTEVMCLAWADESGRSGVITLDDIRAGKKLHIAPNTVLTAHNAHFEFAIYHEVLVKRHGWTPMEDPMRWDCTLARAAMCNLPISLENCGAALGIASKKDMKGREAMLKLCKPIGGTPDSPVYNEDPGLKRVLYEYCMRDVTAEMEIHARLPEMPPGEKNIWCLDLAVNRRGVLMDTKLAARAEKIVEDLTQRLNNQLHSLTGGAVDKASRVAEIKRWLEAKGVNVDSLNKQAVDGLLKSLDISPDVKKVLSIRRQVGKTSTSKFAAIRNVASPVDSRARGLLQYHGASTGRWAGRLIQPHNFPKGVKATEQFEIIESIIRNDVHKYGDAAMDKLSGVLRGTIIAPPGHTLCVADYSSIEPRVLFWLAGDERALNMYRKGEDLYIDLAKYIYNNQNLTKEKNPKERDVGKMGVLGCGYGMGAVRFKSQCAAFGIEISDEVAEKAVRAYRDRYYLVKNLWREVEAAAKRAVADPAGGAHPCAWNRVFFGMDKKREFLICRLPSGRFLRYFKPFTVPSDFGSELRYMGPGLNGSLEVQKTYGGSLVENIVQAIARDIMANGMLNCELAGFDTVLTVHDEVVAEIPAPADTDTARDVFLECMCKLPKWAAGCPIAAEGWVGRRYRK